MRDMRDLRDLRGQDLGGSASGKRRAAFWGFGEVVVGRPGASSTAIVGLGFNIGLGGGARWLLSRLEERHRVRDDAYFVVLGRLSTMAIVRARKVVDVHFSCLLKMVDTVGILRLDKFRTIHSVLSCIARRAVNIHLVAAITSDRSRALARRGAYVLAQN